MMVCSACDFALAPNPCIDIDYQIARSLQLMEEEGAWDSLQREELNRLNLAKMSLLDKAHVLATDIQRRVQVCCVGSSSGIFAIPPTDLVLHSADMIEHFKREPGQTSVDLVYYFCRMDGLGDESFDIIRRQGLMSKRSEMSKDVDIAFGLATQEERGAVASRRDLEDQSGNWDHSVDESEYFGWIVFVVTATSIDKAYPLVAFQAKLRSSDQVARLFNGLLQECEDFFHADVVAFAPVAMLDDNFRTTARRLDDADRTYESPVPVASNTSTAEEGAPYQVVTETDLEMIRDYLNLEMEPASTRGSTRGYGSS
jgi:hypothetical protein